MEVGFSEDQALFRDVVRRFLTDKSPATEVRRLMASESGYDPGVWRQACGEVGLAGIHLPERYGGAGFGGVELGIVAEEMGRALFCGPFLASAVMSGYAILEAGTEAQKDALLPGIADGSAIATLVLDDLNDVARVGAAIQATAAGDSGSGTSVTLSGTAPMVIDAQAATVLVVAARAAEASGPLSLYIVDAAAPGIEITPLTVMDPTRKLSRIQFVEASGTKLGDADTVNLPKIWDEINAVLANEMVGGASHLFETTLDYMKLRVQFGRTIGSFQSLKHRCADLLMELELARVAAYDAARSLGRNDGEPYAASMAKALASDAYMEIAKAAIQLRGGIGFTWEEDTHLWFKRAKSSEVLLGTSAWHREQMIQQLEVANG